MHAVSINQIADILHFNDKCPYERYIINNANLYQTIIFVSEKKFVFRVILGNACEVEKT